MRTFCKHTARDDPRRDVATGARTEEQRLSCGDETSRPRCSLSDSSRRWPERCSLSSGLSPWRITARTRSSSSRTRQPIAISGGLRHSIGHSGPFPPDATSAETPRILGSRAHGHDRAEARYAAAFSTSVGSAALILIPPSTGSSWPVVQENPWRDRQQPRDQVGVRGRIARQDGRGERDGKILEQLGQVDEKPQRQVVGPLDVIDDERNRTLLAEVHHTPVQAVDEGELVGRRGVDPGVARLRQQRPASAARPRSDFLRCAAPTRTKRSSNRRSTSPKA